MLLFFIILTLSVPQQPREVVQAYEVCQKFQTLMAQDLDFDRAYDATFTKDPARRREIAIAEGEFGDIDFTRVDDESLIDAFKSRMQIFYLMMPLMSPDDKREEALFFPPRIKAVFDRKPPKAPSRFRAYSFQLKRDAAYLRAHLERLAKERPGVAERIRKFKKEALSTKLEPPSEIVKPLTAYSRGRVLGVQEPYYQIGEYAVIREGNDMRIIGIRFFMRLF
jgi:hypothetical protein